MCLRLTMELRTALLLAVHGPEVGGHTRPRGTRECLGRDVAPQKDRRQGYTPRGFQIPGDLGQGIGRRQESVAISVVGDEDSQKYEEDGQKDALYATPPVQPCTGKEDTCYHQQTDEDHVANGRRFLLSACRLLPPGKLSACRRLTTVLLWCARPTVNGPQASSPAVSERWRNPSKGSRA